MINALDQQPSFDISYLCKLLYLREGRDIAEEHRMDPMSFVVNDFPEDRRKSLWLTQGPDWIDSGRQRVNEKNSKSD